MLRIKDTTYLGTAVPGAGGGQSYTAGDGIVISGGQIAATSTLLQDVRQEISSGYVAKSDSPDGGYFFITGSGATIGASDTYRVSAGSNAATVKTNTSTGLYLSGTSVTLLNSGKTHYTAGTSVVALYGSNSGIALRLNSTEVAIKHSSDDSYNKVVHVGMSATSNEPGIVQPDNSTCFVQAGGILVAPGTVPTMTWHVVDGGSTVSAPETSSAALTKVYINGMLVQPDEDYSLESGVITLSAPVSSGGKVVTEVYSGASVPVLDGGRSVNLTRSAAPGEIEEPEEEPEDELNEEPSGQEER